jgi:LPS-assembly protein
MKNNFFYKLVLIILILSNPIILYSSELDIKSQNISVDNQTKITIFEGSVVANDDINNKIFADKAEYNKELKTIETFGYTKIITSEGSILTGENVFFDNNKKIISSSSAAEILDKDGNIINLEMFNYIIEKKIFFSKGSIKVTDINNNNYNFSEAYIDETKNKIVGSDVKAHLEGFKADDRNNPRFFANSMTLENGESVFQKGVFTFCANRENNKCPPWVLRSKQIKHNASTKTIYYDNVVLKVYDFPIFYFPRFSHPDPTVKKRSGFLIPNMSNNKSVGAGIAVPYYLAMSDDKDLTITPKFYATENPLLLAEYRQDFKNSFLILDTGFTPGYKKETTKKTKGSKSHIFSKFTYNFINNADETSNLNIDIQKVSNDTYLKINSLETILANNEMKVLNSAINYNYQKDDFFLGIDFSQWNDLTIKDNSKYEYTYPNIFLDKNIFIDDNYGAVDLASNLKIRNFGVDQTTEFLVNDINWKSIKWTNNLGIESFLTSQAKAVNYNASNTPEFKTEASQSELSGVLAYNAKISMKKDNYKDQKTQIIVPKLMLRYAPGHMRDLKEGPALSYKTSLFNLNPLGFQDVVERGLSAHLGIEYEKSLLNKDKTPGGKKVIFNLGQIINAEEDIDKPSESSLDQRFSDVVGESSFALTDNLKLNYNFNIDQNYKDFVYNDISADLITGPANFNVSYLEEKDHIGTRNYISTKVGLDLNNTELTFDTKRNIVTNSFEFYNLSYNYKNDCLKAGLVYRREFYEDRDIEAGDSLMFKVSFIPLGVVKSPTFGK